MKKLKTCTGKSCWICEKSKARVSIEMHDYIMASIKLKGGYFLAFNALADFLIGDEENSRIYNSCGKPDYNEDPRGAALEILRRCGADSKFK